MAGFHLVYRGTKMKTYDVVSIERSIVMPDCMDVELSHAGHLVGVIRLPMSFAKNLRGGGKVDVFELTDETPVAYRSGGQLHITVNPQARLAARYIIMGLPGLINGSLDTFRFRYAMAKKLWQQKKIPNICASANLMKLTRQK